MKKEIYLTEDEKAFRTYPDKGIADRILYIAMLALYIIQEQTKLNQDPVTMKYIMNRSEIKGMFKEKEVLDVLNNSHVRIFLIVTTMTDESKQFTWLDPA